MTNQPIISEAFLAHASSSFLAQEQRDSFIAACRRPLRKSIRVNTLKISVRDFCQKAQMLGLELSPIPWCPEGFWVSDSNSLTTNRATAISSESSSERGQPPDGVSLGNLASHLQGLFYIQEASSMLPPQALFSNLADHQAIKVLDLAAAPGSKTTQMAALMNNTGLLLANEISASRVKSLHANIARCGVANTCISQFDGRKLGERLSNQFDLVLLDAPCGGEGTIRKDPKALENWQLSKVEEIAELQKQLILTAYQCVKPGGRLVYSTCTLSFEENHQVAAYLTNNSEAKVVDLTNLFVGAEKAVTDEGYLHIQPQIFDSEGFFVSAFVKLEQAGESLIEPAKLTKKAKGKKGKPQHKWKSSFSSLENRSKARLLDYFQKHFGIEPTKISGEILQKEKQIWLLPQGSSELNQRVRLNRSGIKLAEIYPNKIRSHHEFVTAFEANISKQKIELDRLQAQDFYRGKNTELSEQQRENQTLHDGEVLLTYQGFVIGLASLSNRKLKNLLPRDLVKDTIKLD